MCTIAKAPEHECKKSGFSDRPDLLLGLGHELSITNGYQLRLCILVQPAKVYSRQVHRRLPTAQCAAWSRMNHHDFTHCAAYVKGSNERRRICDIVLVLSMVCKRHMCTGIVVALQNETGLEGWEVQSRYVSLHRVIIMMLAS